MPDDLSPQLQGRLREALRLVLEAMPPTIDAPELREVAAARRLLEIARDLELETVRDARRVQSRWRPAVRHQTFLGTPLNRTHSWRAIGLATGMTAQSAHERWAHRL